MFTGIITDVGTVRRVAPAGAGTDTRFEIATAYDTAPIALGASICCSGACLTVVTKGPGWFAVEASAETLACTTLGAWRTGSRVNLEQALKVGDELGGHIVSGHVDAVAAVAGRREEGGSVRFEIEVPEAFARYIAPKGSVALDGISLTVNEVSGRRFGVNIIPHTQRHTTFEGLRPGDHVNMEVDVLARYVARQLGKD
jgi:riboflavin synthase